MAPPSSVVLFRTLAQCLLVLGCCLSGRAAPSGDALATATPSSQPELDSEQVRPSTTDAHIPHAHCPGECVCISGYVHCSQLGGQLLPDNIPKDVNDLRLSGNDFDIMPIFPFLPELKSLDMRHNRLKRLSKDDFATVPSLFEADFSHNEIRLGPDTFPANFSIRRLNLNKNKIKNLHSGHMDGCINLVRLSLSRNNISKIEKGFFSTMSKLESLDLSSNKIHEIEGITFKGLGKLQQLNLRRNMLTEMLDGAFYHLQSLKKLLLDFNGIPTLRKAWLYGLPSLQHLNISNNEISVIESDSFEFCPNLTDLDLSNNLLYSLKPNAFKHLTSLKRLDLSSNHMNDISEDAFNHLPNLDTLILKENLLSHVIEDPLGSLSPLGGLKMLDLSRNYISALNERSFEGMTHLSHLFLNDNPMKTIHEKSLEGLRMLMHLEMNSHDLLCYCNLDWLPDYLLRKAFSLDLRCKHPKSLKGDLIRQLDPLRLPCDGFPKPSIVEEPTYLQTKTGDNVTLTCRASAPVEETMKFHWKKDNIVIAAHRGQVDSGLEKTEENWQQKSSLHLVNISASDAATYQCVVFNDYGTTFSQRAKVNVFTSPVFLKRPQNLTLKAGSTAKLECQAEGEPKPEISWHKDGGGYFPAASERRMHVLPADDTFFIVDVKFVDSGTYSCSAENLAGKVSTDVVLTVVEPPIFIKPMENKDVTEGETTVLECMAGGHPKPKLTWTKDSQPLVATTRHFFTAENQLLIIVNSAQTDSGNYQCEIANSVGTERGSSRLTIIPRSVTMASSQSIYVYVVVSVVCCIVVTSFCWVGVIYHTRKRPSATPTGAGTGSSSCSVPVPIASAVALRDVDSDSGHGDSARRSTEDLQLARGYSSSASDVSEHVGEELEVEEEEEAPPEYVALPPAMSTFRPYAALRSPHNSLPRPEYATREEVRACIPRMV